MATSNCDVLISQDIQRNCIDLIVKGIEPNGVIINRQDIDFSAVVFDPLRKNVISALPLKAGKRGYAISVSGQTPFNNTQTTLEAGANRNTFTNDLAFVVLDNDPDVCEKIIDGLANGEFVVVYENKFKNSNKPTTPGDSAFQIVGYYQGLRATTLENNKYSDDTEGGWNVVLQETKTPKSALFLFAATAEATRTLFDGLTQIPA